MDLFTLSARLTLDKSQFDRGTEQAERQGRHLGDSLDQNIGEKGKKASKVLSTIGKAGIAALGAAAVAVGKFAVKAMGMAGELEQQIGGSEAVWGEYAQTIQKKGAEAFEKLGLSQAEYLANANKMGALLQGSGFEASEAVSMTTDAMQRAADIASIMGIDVGDAMQAINGMAKGNFTMMDNLGVKMDDATIKAYAMSKGMSKSAVKNLNQQQKIQLAFEYFMQQSEYAAGNYAKENDTLAGSLNSLKAAFANLMSGAGGADEVSRMLDKALGAILKTFDELAPKVISSLSELLTKVAAKLPALLQTVMPSLISGVILLLNGLVDALPAIMQALVEALPELISGLTNLIPNLLNALGAVFTVVISNLPAILKSLLVGLADALVAIINTAFGLNLPKIEDIQFPSWSEIKTGFDTWWGGIKADIAGAAQWVLNLFNPPTENTAQIVERVSQWWNTTAKSAIVSATDWVLKLFGVPTEKAETIKSRVGEWWSGMRGAAEQATVWALQLFKEPVSTLLEIHNYIRDWFNGGVKAAIESATKWVLQLFGVPAEGAEAAAEKVGEWWAKIRGSVENATSWVLSLFTGVGSTTADGRTRSPEEIVGIWWRATKQNVVGVCKWLLGFFTGVGSDEEGAKSPVDIVAEWWSNVKSEVRNACNWLLGIFTGVGNSEGTAKTPAQIVGEWWSNVKASVINACFWWLKPFAGVGGEEGESTPAQIVGEWWGGVKADVRAACSWLLNLFSGVSATNKDGKTLGQVISGWWPDIAKAIKKACQFVLDLFGLPDAGDMEKAVREWWSGEDGTGGVWGEITKFLKGTFGVDVPDWGTVKDAIVGWWTDNVASLKLSFTAAFSGVQGSLTEWWNGLWGIDSPGSGAHESTGGQTHGGGVGAGFATGLDFVPQNDYVVRTHFGEAILNRGDADAWRSGRGGSDIDYNAFAAAVADALSGMSVQMDGESVGILVAQTVDEQIGVMAHNERYNRG